MLREYVRIAPSGRQHFPLGKPAAYQAVPWFWSNQGPLALQMTGLRRSDCEEIIRGDVTGTSVSVFSFHDGRLAYVESLNRASDHVISRRLLSGRVALRRPRRLIQASS